MAVGEKIAETEKCQLKGAYNKETAARDPLVTGTLPPTLGKIQRAMTIAYRPGIVNLQLQSVQRLGR